MLTIELIPKTTSGVNARTLCTKEEWDRVRRLTYQKAGYVCEICGGTGPEHPVECHEIWSFNPGTKIQKLEGLTALCPICHQVKHMGHSICAVGSYIKGLAVKTRLMRHMMVVNDWTYFQVCTHIQWAEFIQEKRNTIRWTVDVSYLEEVKKPDTRFEFNGGFEL